MAQLHRRLGFAFFPACTRTARSASLSAAEVSPSKRSAFLPGKDSNSIGIGAGGLARRNSECTAYVATSRGRCASVATSPAALAATAVHSEHRSSDKYFE